MQQEKDSSPSLSAAKRQSDEKLRGAVMNEARQTIRREWGDALYERALGRLTEGDREIIEGPLLASSFYPVITWDRFLDAAFLEASRETGVTREQFYDKLVQLGGGRLLQALYKMFLGIMSPSTVAKIIPSFWMRLYTSGRLELLENRPGRCVLRFTDRSDAFRANVTDHLPPGVKLLLEKNGARQIESRVTLDELSVDGLIVEVTTTYQA